jgi:membrane-bound lytic murein transglycosylase B
MSEGEKLSATTGNRSSLFRSLQVLTLCLFLCVFTILAGQGKASAAARDVFTPIKQKLAKDGLAGAEIRLFEQSRPAVLLTTVSQTLRMRESKLNYAQFLDPPSIGKAREFRRIYGPILSQAEAGYGVDHRVIVAILLVETRFGSYTGKTPTLDILATFALMDDKTYRDKVWKLLPAQDKKRWEREAFDRKLIDRSKWAYGELRALLQLAGAQTVRIDSCRGSVMGAIGWPQFLPSSLVRYGVDANKDGRIDLFDPADAVFSVANYLKGYGWKESSSRAGKEEVVYAYNHSRPYVEAILGVAAKLKEND